MAFIDREQVRAELLEGLVCVGIVECDFDQHAVDRERQLTSPRNLTPFHSRGSPYRGTGRPRISPPAVAPGLLSGWDRGGAHRSPNEVWHGAANTKADERNPRLSVVTKA